MANYLYHQEVVLSFYKNFYSPHPCLDDKYIVNYFFSLNIIVEFYKKYCHEDCNYWWSWNRKNFDN